MVCFLCFSDKPPSEVKAKGAAGARNNAMLEKQNNPNQFAVGLKDACCKDPCTCCITCLCAWNCLPACYFRKAVLDKFGNGIDDYVCCQGYVPKLCCIDFPNCCRGSAIGLCCETCCCSVFSLSIARLHIMDAKQIQPDPMDWQIIAFSNYCQILSIICNCLAICIPELEDLAAIIDCIADLITYSVAGCMGAQIAVELKTEGAAPAPNMMTR